MSWLDPLYLIGASYSEKLRDTLLSHNIVEIRDYSTVKVFKDADVYPTVFIIRKGSGEKKNVLMAVMNELTELSLQNSIPPQIFYQDIYWDRYFVSAAEFNIILKFAEFPRLHKFFPSVTGAATVSEAYKIKKFVHEYSDSFIVAPNHYKKLINTGTIDRYTSLWSIKPTRYIKDSYLAPIVFDSDLRQLNETRLMQAKSKKIVIGGMTKTLECYYDEGEYLAGKSTTVILNSDQMNLKYALALLNSVLVSFWYRIY